MPPEHNLFSNSLNCARNADFFFKTRQIALAVASGFSVMKYVSLGSFVRESNTTPTISLNESDELLHRSRYRSMCDTPTLRYETA